MDTVTKLVSFFEQRGVKVEVETNQTVAWLTANLHSLSLSGEDLRELTSLMRECSVFDACVKLPDHIKLDISIPN